MSNYKVSIRRSDPLKDEDFHVEANSFTWAYVPSADWVEFRKDSETNPILVVDRKQLVAITRDEKP